MGTWENILTFTTPVTVFSVAFRARYTYGRVVWITLAAIHCRTFFNEKFKSNLDQYALDLALHKQEIVLERGK